MTREVWTKLLAVMQAPRIYLDTSVFSGCFDSEFERESRHLVKLIIGGRVRAVVGEPVDEEIERAPAHVRELLATIPPNRVEHVFLDEPALSLAQKYIDWGLLTKRSWNDARHLASASQSRADAIASWNFRDIVNMRRMRGFNAVNLTFGYGLLVIVSPQGVTAATESES
jgi:predicted nucleic acid-binding protein